MYSERPNNYQTGPVRAVCMHLVSAWGGEIGWNEVGVWLRSRQADQLNGTLFVEKGIGGKCTMYPNDLFAIDVGSYGVKLKVLMQTKYHSKYTGVTVFGGIE